MKKWMKWITLALCVLFLAALLPVQEAFADEEPFEQTVTIESEKNGAFDYLEYYSGGSWHDLNTPRHWVESTGQVCYCIEHRKGNPHGSTYTAAAPSAVFGAETLAGLQTILMFGYPCNTPEGFTEDEARQATANAIRFWLSENGEEGSYSFTNRKAHPTYIRAKRGYEHVLTWADQLLQMARDKKTLSHSITFTPSALTLTKSADVFTGSTAVELMNINSGYTIDTSSLPEGVSMTGYTGTKSETISFTAPLSKAGQTFTVTAAGKDTRSLENITAYIPSGTSLQKIFLCATVAQVVSRAGIGINTPALGSLLIRKTGEGGSPIEGVHFGIYSDADCDHLALETVTEEDGSVLIEQMETGTWYVKELSTVFPYVLDGLVYPVSVTAEETAVLELENGTAKGVIRIEKKGEVLTGTRMSETAYGQVHTPVYEVGGIPGCVFEIRDAQGNLVASIETDESGIAETGLLPLGTYTVRETEAARGYSLDPAVHSVTLAYLDQNTPIVTEQLSVENELIKTGVLLKKMTDFFNTEVMEFEPNPLEGAVFGLYTGEDFSVIPKNTLVEVLTTDEYGKAQTTAKLPFGNYFLRELAVPEDTIHLLTESYPLTVSGINRDYFDRPIHNERFRGRIAVWKEDETEPGRMLQGAVYEVRDSSGLLYCSMTTDEDGYAVSADLPVGTYYVREITPPEGFLLSDEVTEIVLSTMDKETIEIERTDVPNRVILTKTDLTDGKPVPDAIIEIKDETGAAVFTGETDQNGQIILTELKSGTYTYTETSAPNGYALNPETFTFTVDDYGVVTGTTHITDEPTVLIVEKTDTFTGQPFSGVEFKLTDASGQTIRTVPVQDGSYRVFARDGEDTFFTDENGRAEFRYLPIGEYTLIETAPKGYIAQEEILFSLTETDGISSPKTLAVENGPTGVVIEKVDASGKKPIAGAGFYVKVKSGDGFSALSFRPTEDGGWFADPAGTVSLLMTGSDGRILLYGLPLGEVWMEEYITPEGYFPIPAQKLTVTKEMTAAEPYRMRIENSRFVKLGLDNDWWERPAMLLGILLLTGGAAAAVILIAKKKRRKAKCR